jgi:hypothetical protein
MGHSPPCDPQSSAGKWESLYDQAKSQHDSGGCLDGGTSQANALATTARTVGPFRMARDGTVLTKLLHQLDRDIIRALEEGELHVPHLFGRRYEVKPLIAQLGVGCSHILHLQTEVIVTVACT